MSQPSGDSCESSAKEERSHKRRTNGDDESSGSDEKSDGLDEKSDGLDEKSDGSEDEVSDSGSHSSDYDDHFSPPSRSNFPVIVPREVLRFCERIYHVLLNSKRLKDFTWYAKDHLFFTLDTGYQMAPGAFFIRSSSPTGESSYLAFPRHWASNVKMEEHNRYDFVQFLEMTRPFLQWLQKREHDWLNFQRIPVAILRTGSGFASRYDILSIRYTCGCGEHTFNLYLSPWTHDSTHPLFPSLNTTGLTSRYEVPLRLSGRRDLPFLTKAIVKGLWNAQDEFVKLTFKDLRYEPQPWDKKLTFKDLRYEPQPWEKPLNGGSLARWEFDFRRGIDANNLSYSDPDRYDTVYLNLSLTKHEKSRLLHSPVQITLAICWDPSAHQYIQFSFHNSVEPARIYLEFNEEKQSYNPVTANGNGIRPGIACSFLPINIMLPRIATTHRAERLKKIDPIIYSSIPALPKPLAPIIASFLP